MEAVIFATMQAIQQKIDLVRSFFRLTDTVYAKDFG